MKRLLVATHGNFAEGIKSSLTLLVGQLHNIDFISAYVSEEDVTQALQKFLAQVDKTDEAVIFTDLPGGSVNQKAMLAVNQQNVFIVSGFNLPVILEVYLATQALTEASLQQMIENSRNNLLLVNHQMGAVSEDSESDFFN